jgi:aminoglycoside 2'-N-acetyltransferase I
VELRTARTEELDDATPSALRDLLDRAFEGRISEEDWEHALGGVHFLLLDDDGSLISHASVVARHLETRERMWRTGFVEAVATRPDVQERGHGTTVMRAVNAHIAESYELGALSTGENAFYERLGWQTWRGDVGVRTERGAELMPSEKGCAMVLLTDASAGVDPTGLITCEWRPGDVW